MPPRPVVGTPGGGGPLTTEPATTEQLLQAMAQSNATLTSTMAGLATSQASFMRSAADTEVTTVRPFGTRRRA